MKANSFSKERSVLLSSICLVECVVKQHGTTLPQKRICIRSACVQCRNKSAVKWYAGYAKAIDNCDSRPCDLWVVGSEDEQRSVH